ncbi:hypothetical protein [Lactobacillus acetotolerans]|uniref:hypothetical protein n=1 Tax=Lactobacillus acetotolerans TaxID=1600 RepID=UPI002FD98ACA
MKANEDIRQRIDNARLRKWEVAEKVGISDGRFSVWLRKPFTDEQKKRVEKAIDELTKQIKE